MGRVSAEMVRATVTATNWGGYDVEMLRIASLVRMIQVRCGYLHSCSPGYCLKDPPLPQRRSGPPPQRQHETKQHTGPRGQGIVQAPRLVWVAIRMRHARCVQRGACATEVLLPLAKTAAPDLLREHGKRILE